MAGWLAGWLAGWIREGTAAKKFVSSMYGRSRAAAAALFSSSSI